MPPAEPAPVTDDDRDARIICVTPNVCVDRTLVVPRLVPGAVLRTDRTLAVAGGKGLNVARSLRVLGHRPLTVGMIGGHTGGHVAALAFERAVLQEAARAAAICLCGSLPPGIPPERYGSLVTSLRAAATPVFVDTHGDALVAAAAARPTCLKINAEEAGGLLGRKLATLDDALTAAAELGSAGISQVVITLGHAGAVLAHAGDVLRAEAPDVDTVSAAGSGDAFLAAYVAAQVEGADPVAALRHGVAAGAANAQTSWGGTFDRATYLALLDRVTVGRQMSGR